MKAIDVNGYVNGELIVKDIIRVALMENRFLTDIKNELRGIYPNIVFKVENSVRELGVDDELGMRKVARQLTVNKRESGIC